MFLASSLLAGISSPQPFGTLTNGIMGNKLDTINCPFLYYQVRDGLVSPKVADTFLLSEQNSLLLYVRSEYSQAALMGGCKLSLNVSFKISPPLVYFVQIAEFKKCVNCLEELEKVVYKRI